MVVSRLDRGVHVGLHGVYLAMMAVVSTLALNQLASFSHCASSTPVSFGSEPNAVFVLDRCC